MTQPTVLGEELSRIRPSAEIVADGAGTAAADGGRADGGCGGAAAPDAAAGGDDGPLPFATSADVRQAAEADLFGLALSGGGIRSATFNLGVLQGLAEAGLLARLDYLSTVSGGGYIGAWLTALVHRLGGVEAAQQRLAASIREPDRAVGFLREYSNYLTPRTGLLGADTWSALSIYLRNLTLNLVVLVGVLVSALLLPLLLLPWFERVAGAGSPAALQALASAIAGTRAVEVGGWADWLAFLCFLPAAVLAGVNLRHLHGPGGTASWARWVSSQGAILLAIVTPAIAGAFFIAASTWDERGGGPDVPWPMYGPVAAWWVALWVIVVLVWNLRHERPAARTTNRSASAARVSAAAVSCALVAGVLAAACVGVIDHADLSVTDAASWMTFGPPLVIAIVSLSAVLNLGLMGRFVSEEVREWWARLGAWLMIASLGWMALCLLTFFGPLLLDSAGRRINVAAALTWLGTTGLGLWAGRSATTGGGAKAPNRVREVLAAVAPYVFLTGLLLLLSWLTSAALRAFAAPAEGALRIEYACGWQAWCAVGWCPTLLGWLGALGLALLLSWRVDINDFSLQPLYRNRLVRCYLGASRQRSPHPFTGFDPQDDIGLAELATSPRPLRPYPLVNVALNLVKGDDLAWQERKAAAFTLAPLHCGFNQSYRRTAAYAGGQLTLGDAVATSGAAASPNMGYHSSPALAFLMTIFNVRLGRWIGNPKSPDTWGEPGPRLALAALLSELFGLTNERSRFVYLSDGGHFDNLGLYELLRRRCRFVVACDASADPAVRFDDLGSVIRKCRTDFGIDVTLDTASLRLDPQSRQSRAHCAVAQVTYADGSTGTILYLKASLTGGEAVDVLNYAAGDASFPHQSTADQWFGESQFESYRRLGHHCARTVFEKAAARLAESGSLEGVFTDLRERWYPPLPFGEGSLSRHASRLDALTERLRTNPHLAFLDEQIVPAWGGLMSGTAAPAAVAAPPAPPWLPPDAEARRAGFYFCSSLLQLMESVYLDNGLELYFDHPDNRGWVNLFRHWSWCGMVRVTWALTAATYGARFQSFCRDRLRLTVGEVEAVPARVEDLNFVEQELARQTAGRLHALRLRVADPSGASAGIEFPVGFALVEGDELRYLRIQDQLRKMGLARQAMHALVRRAGVRRVVTTEAPRSAFEASAGRATVERIFESVWTEIGRQVVAESAQAA